MIAGDAAVGKSSSVERFGVSALVLCMLTWHAVKNEFFEFQQPTIGLQFSIPSQLAHCGCDRVCCVGSCAGAAFLTQTVPLDDVIVKI